MGHSILRLDLRLLHSLLELPEECQILCATPQMRYKCLELLLESGVLPEAAEGEPYPLAVAHYSVEYHPDDHAFVKRSVRVEVPTARQMPLDLE